MVHLISFPLKRSVWNVLMRKQARGKFRTLSIIYDGIFCESIQRLQVVNYLHKKAPL